MSVTGAEEDGVDNRAESSLAAGEGSVSTTPDESPEGNPAAAVVPAADSAADSPEAASPSVPDWTPPADPAGAPAYASHNGSGGIDEPAADKPDSAAPAPSATAPLPSLMSAAPSQPGGPSIQDSAAAAMTSAANGAKGVASKISASFSSLTRPRPRPPKQAARRMPPRGMGTAAGGLPSRGQSSYQPPAGPRAAPAGPPARSAMLSLQRIEPLSVMKFTFLISLVGWVVIFVAVAIIWFTLSKLGVFAKIEQTVGLVTYSKNHPGSNAAAWFSAPRVLGYTALVCTVNAILFTALATIGAALYNLVTSLTGGIEVTLKETD